MLNLKVVKNLTAHNKCKGRFKFTNKIVPNINLYKLSRMGLANFVAFLLLKILYNPLSMQNSLNGCNCLHKQNFEKYPV